MMKKVTGSLMMLAVMFMFTACSSGPKNAMEKYGNDLVKGDYVSFANGIATKNAMTAEQNEQFAAMIEDKGATDYAKKGGLKEFKVTSEEIQPGDTTAIVYYQMSYGNGTTQDGEQEMILRNGEWKMNMGIK